MSTGTERLTDQVQELIGQSHAQAQDPSGPVQGAGAQASQAAGALGDRAQAAAGQAQDRLREQAAQRAGQAGTQISTQAADLRSVAEALREQGKDGPARLIDRAAGLAEQAGSYLSENEIDTMLADAESLGRRRPGIVALGALGAGFAASRFLKASGSRRYSELQRSTGPVPGRGYLPPATPTPMPRPVTPGIGRGTIVETGVVGAGAIAGTRSAPIPDALSDPLPDPGMGVGSGPGTRPSTGSVTPGGSPAGAGRPVPGTER